MLGEKKTPFQSFLVEKNWNGVLLFLVEGVGFESYVSHGGSCKNERQKSLKISEVVHSTLKNTCLQQ